MSFLSRVDSGARRRNLVSVATAPLARCQQVEGRLLWVRHHAAKIPDAPWQANSATAVIPWLVLGDQTGEDGLAAWGALDAAVRANVPVHPSVAQDDTRRTHCPRRCLNRWIRSELRDSVAALCGVLRELPG